MDSQYEHMNLSLRINAIRERVTYVQKRQADRGTAAAQADVIRKLRPAMVEFGVLWYPISVEVVESESFTTMKGDKTKRWTHRHYKWTFRAENVDDPNDFRDTPVFSEGLDDQDKGCGKASTYADKYALIRFFNLEAGDDPDLDSIDVDPDVEPERAAAIEKVRALAAQIGPEDPDAVIADGLAKLGEHYSRKVSSVYAVPLPMLEKWITGLEAKVPNGVETEPHPEDGGQELAEALCDRRLEELGRCLVKHHPDTTPEATFAAIRQWLGNDGHEVIELEGDEFFKQTLAKAKRKTQGAWATWLMAGANK